MIVFQIVLLPVQRLSVNDPFSMFWLASWVKPPSILAHPPILVPAPLTFSLQLNAVFHSLGPGGGRVVVVEVVVVVVVVTVVDVVDVVVVVVEDSVDVVVEVVVVVVAGPP